MQRPQFAVAEQGSDCALKSLMASKSLFGHHLLGKSLNVLACVGPPGPTILILCSFAFNELVRKLANQTRRFASWCLRSVLHELLHRLLREALPVGGLCVALHLSKRGMAGDGGYLMRAASRLGKPPRCRFS